MTGLELVRKYFPDIDESGVEYALWTFTAFPFAGIERIEEQLAHARDIGWEAMQKEIDDAYASMK